MRRVDRPFGFTLEARSVRGLTPREEARLAEQGFVTYSETLSPKPSGLKTDERRENPRARTRLRSAKLIGADNTFLCEALVQDLSSDGMRLRLGRNMGLPARFGVHDDLSGALYTVSQAWRRDLTIGVRIHRSGPPSAMKRSDLAALAGRYYGMRN